MHIICPNCGLKTPVETGGLSVETRLICARCEVEFDIKFTDEQPLNLTEGRPAEAPSTEIALFESTELALFEEAEESPRAAPCEAEAGDVLGLEALPPPPAARTLVEAVASEQGQPVIDVGVRDGAAAGEILANADAPLAIEDETLSGTELEGEDLDDLSATRAPFAFERVPASATQKFDKYSVGVRLLQVSPLWLLVSGLSFISFVVVCNWFFVPANVAQADTTRPAARGNQSTNQSAGQTPAPSRHAGDTASAREPERPADSPARATTQPAPAAPVSTPAPAPSPTPAPTQAPAPVAAKSDAERDGKFTVQIGSYNVASEAEARASGLKSAGVEARVARVEIPNRGTWYRVQAGRFVSRDDAERHGRQLREKGIAASYLTAELR